MEYRWQPVILDAFIQLNVLFFIRQHWHFSLQLIHVTLLSSLNTWFAFVWLWNVRYISSHSTKQRYLLRLDLYSHVTYIIINTSLDNPGKRWCLFIFIDKGDILYLICLHPCNLWQTIVPSDLVYTLKVVVNI